MKKKAVLVTAAILTLLFCIMPFHGADVILRLHFFEVEEVPQKEPMFLFYTTSEDPVFDGQKCIEGTVDEEMHRVEFRLDRTLEKKITGLRIDLPATEQRLCIDDVSVLSAGAVKKAYNPLEFFSEDNIPFASDITALENLTIRSRTYIVTKAPDPYLVLGENLVRDISGCFGHFTATRILFSLLLWCGIWFSYHPVFKEPEV